MDELSSWRPQPTPPPLPPPVWQKQGTSLQFKMRNTLDHVASDPQAGPQTHIQKLVAGLDPAKIQEVAASQVEISEMYYHTVLQHARRLFRWALIAAGTGLIFFLAAVALLVWHQPVTGALISLTSRGVMEAIAALNFSLYGRVFNHFREVHERLDRTQQYLLANSICENLKGDVKQATQIELMRAMMHSLARQEAQTEKSSAK
jgi:hypothetical protein